jgi:polyisoprenyl-phosphate glycosyltransferase
MISAPEISGVVPFYNEAEVAGGVIDELIGCMNQLGRTFEIVLVDDGSSDETSEVLMLAQQRWRSCRVLRHPRNLGQAARRFARTAEAFGRRGYGDWLPRKQAGFSAENRHVENRQRHTTLLA